MKRFHIKKDGNIGLCSAQIGNCPLGDFDSHIEASDIREASKIHAKDIEISQEDPLISIKKGSNDYPVTESTTTLFEKIELAEQKVLYLDRSVNQESPMLYINAKSNYDKLNQELVSLIVQSPNKAFIKKSLPHLLKSNVNFVPLISSHILRGDDFNKTLSKSFFVGIESEQVLKDIFSHPDLPKYYSTVNLDNVKEAFRTSRIFTIGGALALARTDNKEDIDLAFKRIRMQFLDSELMYSAFSEIPDKKIRENFTAFINREISDIFS